MLKISKSQCLKCSKATKAALRTHPIYLFVRNYQLFIYFHHPFQSDDDDGHHNLGTGCFPVIPNPNHKMSMNEEDDILYMNGCTQLNTPLSSFLRELS